jgi:glycosyltransferase 2 family protein
MSIALRRIGRAALIALSFLFLGLLLVRQREQLLIYDWQVHPLRLTGSIILFAAVLVASVGIWGRALRQFDVRVPFPILARIWFLSNLSRYIPGKIWQFVGVAEMSHAAGVAVLTSITSLLMFMGFTLIAACVVGAALLPATGPLGAWGVGLRLVAPLLLLLAHPRVINAAVRVASRITRRPLATWSGSWFDGLLLVGLCLAEWVGMGIAFTLFIGSLAPVGLEVLPTATAAFALSFVAGFAVLLPAGLGAKEGALAVLLSTIMPLPVAAAIAVASRVWTVLAELLPVCIFLLPVRWWTNAHPGRTEPRTADDRC